MRARAYTLAAIPVGLLLFTVAPRAAGPTPVRVISPPASAVLPSGHGYVICTGGPADLVVDGRPRPWGAFAGPVRAAKLRLAPGRHELRIGEWTVSVWVGGDPPPQGGRTARVHPIGTGADACASCHETARRDGLTAVGHVKTFGACLECHRPAEFEAAHAHPLKPLEHCGSCHAPHGSPYRSLLKEPAKKLCAACHDS
jgi:predicted CXXCH cytochrome family protein